MAPLTRPARTGRDPPAGSTHSASLLLRSRSVQPAAFSEPFHDYMCRVAQLDTNIVPVVCRHTPFSNIASRRALVHTSGCRAGSSMKRQPVHFLHQANDIILLVIIPILTSKKTSGACERGQRTVLSAVDFIRSLMLPLQNAQRIS